MGKSTFNYRIFRKTLLDSVVLEREQGVYFQCQRQEPDGIWKNVAEFGQMTSVAKYLMMERKHVGRQPSLFGSVTFDPPHDLEWSEKYTVFVHCEHLSDKERTKLCRELATAARDNSDAASNR